MAKPFFSVIIPTYNREGTILRAINSVLKQTFQNYELIIVDDGSTDNTSDVLSANFNAKIIYQENLGVSAARNLGVKNSNGQWLAFLDSDDEWLEDKLQKQFDYIRVNPEYSLIHGDEVWIRNGVRVNQMKKHKKGGGDQFLPSLSLCLISPSCVVLKRDLFNKYEGFREDFEVCEDYDLWLKITAEHKIGFLDEYLINKYGGHEDQLSRKFFAMDYWRVISMYSLLNSLSGEKKEALLKVLLKKIQILIKGYTKHGHQSKIKEMQMLLDNI